MAELVPYRRGLRPPLPESLPSYLDAELQKLTVTNQHLVETIKDLQARIAALEP